MINQDKISSSMSNPSKINIGETWASDLNTWDNELRTWAETISIISNLARTSSGMTNVAKPI